MKVVMCGMAMGRAKFLRFVVLALVAVGGSLLFGAALASTFPHLPLVRGALWMTLSAGSGWLVLGLLLCKLTTPSSLDLAEACLVTMAWSEAILVSGALFDWFVFGESHSRSLDPILVNGAIVVMSNLVMAWSITVHLGKLGVPVRTSILLWILGLDGSGAIFFVVFYRLLFGGHF